SGGARRGAAGVSVVAGRSAGGGGAQSSADARGILLALERAAAPCRLRTRRLCAPRHREGLRVKFAIRDDDTCYFTAPDALARVYSDVWDRVPVGLATVPFAIGYERAGIPREHWHSGNAFPLERN